MCILKQKGGFISEKVDLHEFMDTGRGVIAKQQIFNLEKIIKISHKLVITGSVAKKVHVDYLLNNRIWAFWSLDESAIYFGYVSSNLQSYGKPYNGYIRGWRQDGN